MNTLVIKAFRDLTSKKLQSAIIIAALALGIIGVGAISNVYTILKREMQKNYDMTNPPTFIVNVKEVTPDIKEQMKELAPKYDWEFRGSIAGRVQTPEGTWKSLILEVIPDFNRVKINRFFFPESQTTLSASKSKYPGSGGVFIEKAAFPIAKKRIGEDLIVLVPGHTITTLPITGTIHAPALPPAWMENWVYGFISEQTAMSLTGKPGLNRILFQSHTPPMTTALATSEAEHMKQWLKSKAIAFESVTVPVSGAHPHAGQMNSLLYMMQVFGVIALFLAAALVGNIFGTMLARQKREIGIMKSIGANSRQILSISLMQAGMLAGIALMLAFPLGQFLAQKYSAFTANILNFTIYDATIPLWGYTLQIIVGIGIPLFMMLFQIFRSLKLTVKEILTDYGIKSTKKNFLFHPLPNVSGFTPLMLSFRNAFRKKGRMALLLVSLTAGGVLFMISQNISQSIGLTINNLFSLLIYDATFTISKVKIDALDRFFSDRKEIAQYEIWQTMTTVYNGREIIINALPVNASQVGFSLNKNDIVVSHSFAGFYKKNIGELVTIETPGGGSISRKINSIVKVFGTPTVYLSENSLSEKAKESFSPMVTLQYKDPSLKKEASADHLQLLLSLINKKNSSSKTVGISSPGLTATIENAMNAEGMIVMKSENKEEAIQAMIAHMRLIATFLTAMSFLSLIVGALTIISSVSLSILERRREIGILRAFGTQGKNIVRLFALENGVIGMIAFICASIIAYPVGVLAGNAFGMIFLQIPLSPAVSHGGIVHWLFTTVFLTFVFSWLPAQSASGCELSGLLEYE
jgi:putative ABC transport system permease protein